MKASRWTNPLFIFESFPKKVLIMLCNLLMTMVPLKKHEFKRKCKLYESFYFKWLQLIDSIPQRSKFIIKENY